MSGSKGVPLEEDVYTEALSHIIERDFFPDLKVLKAEAYFLDSLETQDPTQIRLAQERLENINRPTSPPALVSNLNEDERTEINTALSIDQFQANYTSEDNASFHLLLKESNNKIRKKLAWMFNEDKNPTLAITDGPVPIKPAQVLGWPHSCHRIDSSGSKETRDCPHAKNSLMFTPDVHNANDLTPLSQHQALPSASNENPSHLVSKRKAIQYQATRFDSPTPLTQLLKKTEAVIPPTHFPNATQPYALVPMTPVPLIDEAPPAMTWGTIESTPLPLPETPAHYQVPSTPKREELLHKLTIGNAPVTTTGLKRRKIKQSGDSMLRASYSRSLRSRATKNPNDWTAQSQRSTVTSISITPIHKK